MGAISDPQELSKDRLRRSAGGQVHAMEFWSKERVDGHNVPSAIVHHEKTGTGGRQRLAVPFGGAGFFTALLADAALAGGRFLHLSAHGAEIVSRRDYREENDEHASQGQ